MFVRPSIAAFSAFAIVFSAYGQDSNITRQPNPPIATNFRYQGKTFPVEVDLSELFPENLPQQRGGFCHVFAATALLQSACYRALGKRVDLSEGYFCYRHIRNRLSSCKRLPIGSAGIFSVSDGFAWNTMDRFLSGSYCDEAQCTLTDFWSPLEASFEKHRDESEERKKVFSELNDPLPTKQKLEALHRSFQEQRIPGELTKSLDSHFLTILTNPTFSTRSGVVNAAIDSDLEACRKAIRRLPSEESPSVERILELLTQGIPFVCSTQVEYKDRAGKHAVVVLGYRHDSTEPFVFRYLIRDSNLPHPVWLKAKSGARPCERIDLLTLISPGNGE